MVPASEILFYVDEIYTKERIPYLTLVYQN